MAIPPGLLQGIDRLDPLPVTVQRLIRAANDENAGPALIADIVQYDPAVATSVLRLANSAAFGGWSRTETIRDAIVRLGKSRVLDIVLGDHLKRLKLAAPLYDLAEDEIWLHSAAASLAVKALLRERPRAGIPECATVAALVHDIGKLVMVRYLHTDVSAILALRNGRKVSFVDAERELCGCDHAEVGGEMARRWGFPEEIHTVIRRHHDVPLDDSNPTLDAVVIANLAAKAIGTGLGAEGMDLAFDERCPRRLRLDFAGFSRVCMQTVVWLRDLKSSYGVR